MGRRLDVHGRPSPYYPPPSVLTDEARVNIENGTRFIETPVFESGLINFPLLFKRVEATIIDPAYDWDAPIEGDEEERNPNIHHGFYIDEKDRNGNRTKLTYPKQSGAVVNPGGFRESARRKVKLNRRLHRHLHDSAIQPPVPSYDQMYFNLTAERHLDTLKLLAQQCFLLLSRGEEYLDKQTVRNMLAEEHNNYLKQLDAASSIPKEFAIVDSAEAYPRCVTDMERVGAYLGRLCVTRIPTKADIEKRAAA